MQTYAIQSPDGSRWLTQFGWTTDVRRAMTFRTEADGRAWAASMPALGDHTLVEVEAEDDMKPTRYATAETNYDPFGLKKT